MVVLSVLIQKVHLKQILSSQHSHIYYRWNAQKGGVVGERYSQWHTDEPNLEDFDYNTRSKS